MVVYDGFLAGCDIFFTGSPGEDELAGIVGIHFECVGVEVEGALALSIAEEAGGLCLDVPEGGVVEAGAFVFERLAFDFVDVELARAHATDVDVGSRPFAGTGEVAAFAQRDAMELGSRDVGGDAVVAFVEVDVFVAVGFDVQREYAAFDVDACMGEQHGVALQFNVVGVSLRVHYINTANGDDVLKIGGDGDVFAYLQDLFLSFGCLFLCGSGSRSMGVFAVLRLVAREKEGEQEECC